MHDGRCRRVLTLKIFDMYIVYPKKYLVLREPFFSRKSIDFLVNPFFERRFRPIVDALLHF